MSVLGTYLLPFAEPIYQHVSEKEEREGRSTSGWGTRDPQTDTPLAPVQHMKPANIFDPFQREPTFFPSCFLISVPRKKS